MNISNDKKGFVSLKKRNELHKVFVIAGVFPFLNVMYVFIDDYGNRSKTLMKQYEVFHNT